MGLNKRLRILFGKAGLPYKSAHKFRHGHATWGLQHCQTMPYYKALSLNLMHGSLEITDTTYAHILENDVRKRIGNLSSQPIDQPDDELGKLLAQISPNDRSMAIHILSGMMMP